MIDQKISANSEEHFYISNKMWKKFLRYEKTKQNRPQINTQQTNEKTTSNKYKQVKVNTRMNLER